jgi:hypothetical protein
MAILLMLGWWYGQGWQWVLRGTLKRLQTISHVYAVRVLLRTWFSPWKQIYTQSTFQTFFRDAVDNAVSRAIGAVVRGAILLWAAMLSLFTILLGILSLIAWPFIPLLIVILPVLALSGVTL